MDRTDRQVFEHCDRVTYLFAQASVTAGLVVRCAPSLSLRRASAVCFFPCVLKLIWVGGLSSHRNRMALSFLLTMRMTSCPHSFTRMPRTTHNLYQITNLTNCTLLVLVVLVVEKGYGLIIAFVCTNAC